MSDEVLNKATCLASLPPEWPDDLLPEIRSRVRRSGKKIVVLDDDPTGTQTVHGLPVFTVWSVETLRKALLAESPAFFILTNSRSLTGRAACDLALEIGTNLKKAAELAGVSVEIISRSDSTLRGHFPMEVDTVAKAMGIETRPYLLMPFFPEGGRFTIGDIHYVAEAENLVPAAMTAYAQDAVFGYTSSNLKAWVEEKTAGRIKTGSVTAITIRDIRRGGPGQVGNILNGVPDDAACIVNAASYRDVEVLVAGLQKAAAKGHRFLFRTAAAFVRVMAGIKPQEVFLSKEDLVTDTPIGGLFVVGSYVPKTTAQIHALLEMDNIVPVEVSVAALLDESERDTIIEWAARAINTNLEKGSDVVIYTSRELISAKDAESNLDIGRIVSESLIRIVKTVHHQPRYLVAKGGITSSDVATKALNVRRAMITGQVMPGVSVWRLENESRYPGMSYIVFPGNVGDDNALVTIQKKLA